MPAVDGFDRLPPERLVGPARSGQAVTPHDTNELTNVSRMLWVGGAGAMSVVLADGTTLLFSGIPAGTMLPIQAKQVRATGTTATLILALY